MFPTVNKDLDQSPLLLTLGHYQVTLLQARGPLSIQNTRNPPLYTPTYPDNITYYSVGSFLDLDGLLLERVMGLVVSHLRPGFSCDLPNPMPILN